MSKVQKTFDLFTTQHHNCNQCLLVAFGDKVGLDDATARSVGRAFGSGMGQQGEVCGAVTGAVVLLGFKGADIEDEEKAQDRATELAKEFFRRFKARHGALRCKELLGVDKSTEAGRKEATDRKLSETHCRGYVTTVAEILDDML